MSKNEIVQFAISKGYEGVSFLGEWNGYTIFEMTYSYNGMECVCFPNFVMVKDENIRLSDGEESYDILEVFDN